MKTVSFIRTVIGAAALAAFAGQAGAVTLLTLDDVSARNTSNPEDIQCIIYGNSCPGGKQDMAALNYVQTGNQTLFDLTSDPNQKGNLDPKAGPVISDYTVGYLQTFVGRVFGIGIDVNTAGGADPERLVRFEVNVDRLNVAGGFVTEFLYAPLTPTSLDPAFNGNGFFDFTLNTIDLTSYAAGDLVQFRVVFDQASNGAENFFVYRGALPPIPEPSTYALMLGGLGAVGFMARRRRKG